MRPSRSTLVEIGQEREHAAVTVSIERAEINRIALDGRFVNFEIAGVNDDADGRGDGERDAIHQRMRDADEFDLERPDLEAFAWPDGVHLGLIEQAELLQFAFDQAEGEARGINRRIRYLQQERQRADVIFVRVREHDGK